MIRRIFEDGIGWRVVDTRRTDYEQPLPRISFRSRGDGEFYFDGLSIRAETALHYWAHGGAVFAPFAQRRIKQILAERQEEADWLRRRERKRKDGGVL